MSAGAAATVWRILIADDDAAVREAFRRFLSPEAPATGSDQLAADLAGATGIARPPDIAGAPAPAGAPPPFAIDCAAQEGEAIALVRCAVREQTPYALAFVGGHMRSSGDGLGMISTLWDVDPDIEVVLCTASSEYPWEQVVARLGCTDRLLIMSKPLDRAEVRQLALSLTAKWQWRRDAEARRGERLSCGLQAGQSGGRADQRPRDMHVAAPGAPALTLSELADGHAVRGEHARVMITLLELSTNLATTPDAAAVVQYTIRATAELANCRRVSVMLPDAEGEALIIAGALGMDPGSMQHVRVPVGSGIAGRVFRDGQAIVVNGAEERIGNKPQYDSEFFVSAPLTSRALVASGRIVGVLNITERIGGRPFTPAEIETVDMVCNMAASALNEIQARQAREQAHDAVVRAIATLVEYRDCSTGQHLDRVTGFAVLLAEELRQAPEVGATIDDAFIQDLRRAMPLHDIGKVAIPDYVLGKRGKLNQEEMRIMRRHSEIGAQAICTMMDQAPGARFLTMAAEIAECHHERFDGSGYPCGLSGRLIPLSARIAALADVYDALTSQRAYKEAFSHERTAEIIRQNGGKHFDPLLVQAFCARQADFATLNAKLADAAGPPGDADALPEPIGALAPV